MKIRKIVANNRRKVFEIAASNRQFVFPYAKLRRQPTASNRVQAVFADPDIGDEGFTYRLEDGSEDTIHVDAVLEYNEDPEYMRELLLHRLTLAAKERLTASDLPRREIIRRLGTSASQFYRLVDETNYKKSFGQLFDLFYVLGFEVDVRLKPRRTEKARST